MGIIPRDSRFSRHKTRLAQFRFNVPSFFPNQQLFFFPQEPLRGVLCKLWARKVVRTQSISSIRNSERLTAHPQTGPGHTKWRGKYWDTPQSVTRKLFCKFALSQKTVVMPVGSPALFLAGLRHGNWDSDLFYEKQLLPTILPNST